MGRTIGILVIIVLIVAVGIFVVSSGLLTKESGGLSKFFPPISTSFFGTSTVSRPGNPYPGGTSLTPAYPFGTGGTGTGSTGQGQGATGGSGQSGTRVTPSEIPPGFTAAQISPFFHEVRIGTAFAGYGASSGEITLVSYLPTGESVDVTGWELRANHGSEFVPQAVELYQPSGFASPTDIRLSGAQTLYLYSSAGTISLRLNECIGYLQRDLNTSPQLPANCPEPAQSDIAGFTGACQNYVRSIPSCTVPSTGGSQVPPNDYACQQYLSTMNYTGCFNRHEADANFLSNQWWVWTGNPVVDQYHDVVNLFDRSGLLVDQYSY
ncbi:MAG TPA: hypothetical protein VMT99_04060 [Candidatus Paceibacterota bacterium]|nr:hypothetical protein [Candidatus Paceibacterota bacterium]